MTDTNVQPRAHARIVYLGPVSPHWEVYGDYGDRSVLDDFLKRSEETQRMEGMQISQVRVLSEAKPPVQATWPKPKDLSTTALS